MKLPRIYRQPVKTDVMLPMLTEINRHCDDYLLSKFIDLSSTSVGLMSLLALSYLSVNMCISLV